MFKDIPNTDKYLIDTISVATAIGTITNLLPSIAAVLTIVWTGIRIYETETVQKFLGIKKND